jgi:hypothetical protein
VVHQAALGGIVWLIIVVIIILVVLGFLFRGRWG